MMSRRLLLLIATASAQSLPEGVTICDGRSPVGAGKALVLQRPIPYCMNGGTCNADYAEDETAPCDCASGFEGPHCEFVRGTKPTCNRVCYAGGTCQAGAKSFELVLNKYQSVNELQYCLCPEGRSGDNCEKESQPCGGEWCMHGGTCVEIADDETGDIDFYCDCTTATLGEDAFAGKFCEYKATTYCSDEPEVNGTHFCVNGGTCYGSGQMGCHCDDGYIGPICEFEAKDIEYAQCNMQCQNGGICQKGAKDRSFLKKFGLHRHLAPYNDDFEHCVCPRGFDGLACEYQIEVCPGRELVCMHGGQCQIVVNDGQAGLECDCSSARTGGNRYMGEFCEMRSTEFCTLNGTMTPSGLGYDSYCTNGGICNSLVEMGQPHPGCQCSDGFYGDHCEYGQQDSSSMSPLLIGLTVGAAVLGLFAVVVLCVIIRRKRSYQKRVQIMRRAYSNKSYKDAAPAPTMDHINKLGPWLQAQVNLRDLTEHHLEEEDDMADIDLGDGISSLAPSESLSRSFSIVTDDVTFTETAGAATLMKSQHSANGNADSDISAYTSDTRSRHSLVNV